MIWDSIFLMTVIDFLIVGVAGYALAYFLKSRTRRGTRRIQRGFGAIILGLTLIGGFFLADLMVMHVLPLFAPMVRVMAVMTDMHLDFHWVASLLGIGLIGFGLVAATRRMFAVLDRLEASGGELKRELALRAESERALRESEARLKRAQQQAKLGYWRWSFAEERLTYWSEETARLYGHADGQPEIGYNDMVRAVHPEDRDRVLEAYRAADARRRNFEIEYRLLTADGEIRHIHEVGEVEYDAAGGPVAHVGTVQDVTELKKAEEALRKSEASLANAQRIAHLGNWGRDLITNELWWSDETYRIFGLEPQAFGATYEAFLETVHPDDRRMVREAVEKALALRQNYSVVHRIVLPDGEVRFVHEQGEVTCDDVGNPIRIDGTVHDITDSKRAEEALRESEARLAGILDIAPEAVISIDRSGRIQLFNQGAEAIFGHGSEELLGQPLEVLLPPRFHGRHAALVEAFDRAPEASRLMSRRGEIVGLRRDGTEFSAEASISKLDLGEETLFTVLLRDITERKAAESAILLGKEQAEIANRAKSEFLANMSHELRTPLNAIIGFAEIIMGEVLGSVGNAKYRDYAKDISDSGQHLLEIINDILDLSKIETGQVALREEEIDVPAAVRSCLKLLKERAKSAGVELVADFGNGAYPLLRADRRMLKQILVNLLSNAVKFTPCGGRVTASAQCDRARGCVLQISDTGIGIAPDDIPKALARFGQVDARLDRRFEGAGLGLPLSKSFVELHGGALELTSEVGVGTTVKVRFPPGRMLPLAEDIGSQDRVTRQAG